MLPLLLAGTMPTYASLLFGHASEKWLGTPAVDSGAFAEKVTEACAMV